MNEPYVWPLTLLGRQWTECGEDHARDCNQSIYTYPPTIIRLEFETNVGFQFGAYEAAKRTLADLEGHGDTHHINPYSKFVAGGVAGMVSQCVRPLLFLIVTSS